MPSKPNSVEYLKSRLEGFVFNPSKHWSEYPCMIWGMSLYTGGYGQITVEGRKTSAHIVAFKMVRGPVSDGLQLDHLCRVRACFCPAHLESVTQRENIIRGVGIENAAIKRRSITHCPQGHPYSPENIQMKNRSRSRGCRECNRIDARVHSAASRAYYKLKSLLTFQPST